MATSTKGRVEPSHSITNRMHSRLEPPLITVDSLTKHRDSAWIGGCERCRTELISVCRQERFTPRVAYFSDDIVVVQALVAAGKGVASLPGLALQAHRNPDVHTTELHGYPRQIFAVTYGEPPDPPATTALIQALETASASGR